jgi:hypothetical protein
LNGNIKAKKETYGVDKPGELIEFKFIPLRTLKTIPYP